MTAAPTFQSIDSFHHFFRQLDRVLNKTQAEILKALSQQQLPGTLPENPRDLSDLPDGVQGLISLYCFCDVAYRDLCDGGLVDIPQTYRDFRTIEFPQLRSEV